jgi:hypothetical protein
VTFFRPDPEKKTESETKQKVHRGLRCLGAGKAQRPLCAPPLRPGPFPGEPTRQTRLPKGSDISAPGPGVFIE